MNGRTLRAIFRRLFAHYGPQGWWPAETPFEVMVGAVLTQNTAWSNVEKLEEQIRTYSPALVALSDEAAADRLRVRCKGLRTKILGGVEGLVQTATMPDGDLVISAIVGGFRADPVNREQIGADRLGVARL